jgi:ribosome-binding protein aMBF1 (putative translation factor)
MNERYRLNSEAIRAYLEREGRKHSYLSRTIGCSDALVDRMLRGHVPKDKTLRRLAAVVGIEVEKLLIPLDSQRTA